MLEMAFQTICNAGALAVQHYLDVTGFRVHDPVPDEYVSAYIFQSLCIENSLVVRPTLSQLLSWNYASSAHRKVVGGAAFPSSLSGLVENRVDLVLFRDQRKKELFALVEVKRSWVDSVELVEKPNPPSRIGKLLAVLSSCEYGMTCGWMPNHARDRALRKCKDSGTLFVEKRFVCQGSQFSFCGLITRRG